MARLEDASQCAARTVGLSDDVIAVLRVCAVCRPLDAQVSDAILCNAERLSTESGVPCSSVQPAIMLISFCTSALV